MDGDGRPRMITIDYFSDLLCVWAYGGQVRLDALQRDARLSSQALAERVPGIDALLGTLRWAEIGPLIEELLDGDVTKVDHAGYDNSVVTTFLSAR